MQQKLKTWVESAQVLLELNDRSFRSLQSALAKQREGVSGLAMLERKPEESLSAEELFQKLFDTYDDALVEGYIDLRARCLSAPSNSILLFPVRTLFEMATRRAPQIFSESTRPRKIGLISDFSALAFSGSLGYTREEFLRVLEAVVDDEELPKGYTLVLNQVIDAVEDDDKALFDQLLLDLRRAELTGIRREQLVQEWLWDAPRDRMFSNISHLLSGNPFTVMHLNKEDLAVWRFYAVVLQSDMYLLRLCERMLTGLPPLVSEAQETAYRRLQEEGDKLIPHL